MAGVNVRLRDIVTAAGQSVLDDSIDALRTFFRPTAESDNAPSNSVSSALEDNRVVKASAGTIYGFTVFNNGVAQNVQLHNATSLPSDGAVPFMNFPIGAGETLPIDFGIYGVYMGTGIVIAVSSTATTLTDAGDDLLINVQYK